MQFFYRTVRFIIHRNTHSLCLQRLVTDNMECYSTILHKSLVQFVLEKKSVKLLPNKFNKSVSFLITSLSHPQQAIHKSTFQSPLQVTVASTVL